jgi:hypothetical protein
MIKMISIIHIETGLTLFSKTFEKFCLELEDDVELVGCLISAIDTFTIKLRQRGLKFIEMTNLDVILYDKSPIKVIICIDKEDNTKDYKRIVSIIANSFVYMYKTELKESINETSLFQEFNEELQEILNLPMEEITATCPNCDFEKKCDCVYSHYQKKLVERRV